MIVRTLKSRFTVLAVLLAAASPLCAATYTATTSGDFNTAANYTPQPTGGLTILDDIIIGSNIDMTLSTVGTTTVKSVTFAATGGGSITINASAQLTVAGFNGGGIYGIELADPGSSNKYIQVNSGGTLSATNKAALYGGAGVGTTALRSTGGTISVGSIAFNGPQPTKGVIDLSSATAIFKIQGDLPSGGTLTTGVSTFVEFNGTSATQAVGGYSYYNLKINKAVGTAQLSSGIDVAGDLNAVLGTFATNGQTAVIDGSITGSGTIDMTSGGLLRISGSFNNSGVFLAGSGSVQYEGGSGQNVKATTYNDLVFTATNTNGLFLGPVTTNTLTMDASTYAGIGSNLFSITGNAIINGAISTAGGSVAFTGLSGTVSGSGGIIGPNTTMATRSILAGTSLNFLGNLTLGLTATVTNAGAVDVDGSLQGSDVTGQWINSTNSSLTVGANAFSLFGSLVASASGNTVTYDGFGLVTIAATTYQNLVLTSTGASTKSYTAGSLPVNGDLTISGQTTFNGSSPITVGGNVSITTSAAFVPGANAINVGGNWTRTGTFTPGTSTVQFFGTSSQTISGGSFNNISFNGLGVKSFTGALDVNGTFAIGAGSTVTAGNFVHTVAGNWSNSGTFTAGTGEIVFDPTFTVSVGGTTFNKLSVAGTLAGGIMLSSAVNVTSDLTLTTGDIQLISYTLTVGGNTTIANSTFLSVGTGSFIFSGNVTSNGSVNSSPGGTVKATGTAVQTWGGTTAPAFANLWVFKTGGSLNPTLLFNVSGTLTLDGIMSTSGNIVDIAASGSVIRNSGWVDGRVSHNFTGAGTALYPLGTALGYSPVSITVATAGALDVGITNGPEPNNSSSGTDLLQVYWTVNPTTITGNANLTFNWPAGAVNGTEANYVLGRYSGGWSQPGGTVGTNTASITATPFLIGNWTAGEPAALGAAATFEITGPTTVTAGTSNTFTITAKDALNNTDTGYTGDHTLQFSGASTALWTLDAPTATDKNAIDVVFANNTVVTFTNGVATTNIKLYRSQTANLNITEASGPSTASAYAVQVDPAAASQLDVSSVTFLNSPYTNAPFSVGISSYDPYGNTSPVIGNTDVAITLTNCGGCTGTLGGNTTGTIAAGDDTVTIPGVTYSAADANVIFTATRTAGDVLTSNDSVGYSFAPQVSGIVVTTDADNGAGSLREALQRNNDGECAAACQITFNIAPSGAHEISLLSSLPAIEQPATIDGSSQPGYTGTPIISLNGIATNGNGLDVESDNTTIQGLIIRSFTGAGIAIDSFDVLNVQNCWIGTNVSGTAASANGRGIKLTNAYACTIGGTVAGEGNVISGNTGAGIQLFGNTTYTTISGNYIGTNASGTAAIPNGSGINIEDSSSNNSVGDNVISGNTGAGVYLEGSAIVGFSVASNDVHAMPVMGSNANANDLKNNFIGTNAAGTAAIPNAIGVELAGNATANALGTAGNGNIISGNSGAGISISGSGNNDTYIKGNAIGVKSDGISPLGNGGDGISLAGTSNTHIGGTGGGDDNEIAFNGGNGITVASGSGNDILGNSIHDNTLRGIELGADGTDTQDDISGDSDGGANGKQNWPVISSVQLAGGNLIITASANSASTSANSLRVEYFKADSSGSGEGKSLIASTCIAFDNFGGTTSLAAGGIVVGDFIVGTITSFTDAVCGTIGDGTSEFSPAAVVAACTPPAATITPGGPTTFCTGGNVILTASTGTSWLWSNGLTTQSITVTTSGNYSVTVTDASGCSATSAATTVTVNPIPTATITPGGATTFCAGGSVNLTASTGASWLWSNGLTTQTINVTVGGSYSVTVTSAAGCTSSPSTPIIVTVNPAPIASITPGGPTTFCAGGSVLLTATTGTSWLWSSGQTSQSITVTTGGSYSVTVTDASGCSATSGPTVVVVNPNPTATITAGGPTTFCAGGSVALSASAGTAWLWSNGQTSQSINVTTGGSYSVTVTSAGGCQSTSAATSVTVNPAPIASITPGGPTTFCAGGSVLLTASTGTSWLWSNGQTTQSITVTAGGSFSVTVTDASGCSATSGPTVVVVNANPAATITPSGPTTFCASGSVNLTASSGTAWLWSNGQTSQSINVTVGGSYSVTVTSAGGCQSTSAATSVTVNPAPIASITPGGPTTFCAGGSVLLTATTGTSWLWSSGQTSQSITVTTGGSFSVTVTDANGCSATSGPTVVLVNANPAATITVGGPTTFCAGGSVALSASAGTAWLWSNGQTTQSINASTAGSYTVTVTSAGGCQSTSAATSVTVTPLPTASITASGPTTFCAGGSVTLTATSGASWLWSDGQTTQSINVTTGGSYSVTVTDNGCSATSAATVVTVNPLPITTIAASGPTSFCAGGSVTLTASAGASWLWSDGQTTQSINVTTGGNYFVTVTNAAGCSAQSAPLTVTVTPAPVATITAGGPTSFCAGGSVTLTASNGASWLWSDGQTTQSITVTAGGSYTVTVTDAGCSTTSAPKVVTVNPLPVVNITGPTGMCPGGSVTLDAGVFASYLWSNGATTQTINVTPAADTTYSVTVTNGSGCTASDSHTVTVGTATVATIAAPAAVCANSSGHQASVPFQSGASYLWTITGGTIDNGAGTSAILFTANPSGNVAISVTVTQGSCTSSGNVTIPIGAVPTPVITGPSTVCPSVNFTLDAGAGFDSYLWSNGATTQTITLSQTAAQTYVVSVTSGGCTANASKVVTMSGSTSATITAPSAVDPSTGGHGASVAAQPGATYLWSVTNGSLTTGQGTNAITFASGASGNVGLSVTVTLSGCTATGSASVGIGIAEADLVVTKSGPASVVAGGTMVYTINVTNNGPSVATGLQIVDELPAGVTVVSVQSGFVCTNDPGAVYCTGNGFLGVLAPITITVTAPSQAGTITNLVRVSSSLVDPDPANNTATVTTVVTPVNTNCPTATAQLITPTPGSSLASPVTFAWTPVPQAIGYRVWVAANGGPEQAVGTTDGALSLSASVPAGALVASIEALFINCPGTRSQAVGFTVTAADGCSNRGTATPSSPANDSVVNSSSVTFQWLAAANADAYRLWVSIDGGTPQVLGETTETSSAAVLSRGTATWWVEALYDGCASTESQRLRFTIPAAQQCGTQTPSLLAPAAGAVVEAGSVNFSWTAVSNAAGYELWLAHENGTPTLVRATGPAVTSVSHEVPAGALEWFVRVLADRCPSRDSAPRRFSATSPASCLGNDRAVLISPIEKAQVASPVTFRWSPSRGATRYELYIAHGNQQPELRVGSSAATTATGVAVPNGRARWFVRTYFGENCPPLDSAEQLLVIVPQPNACAPLATPVISAPGEISSSHLFSINWSPVPGATGYQLELADNAGFTGAEAVSTTATQHDLFRNNSGNTPMAVHVRVRALDNRCTPAGTGAFGASVIFILPANSAGGAATAGDGTFVSFPLVLGPELAGQTYSAVPTQPWLIVVEPSSGVVPPGGRTLIVRADTTALPLGTTLGGVTITLSDPSSGRVRTQATSSTTPVSVSIVTPITPTPKNAPPPDALLIPAVAHADGINAKFQSDVRVSNTSPRLMKYQLTFTPSGATGITSGRQTTFSIDPGRTIALDDILKTWFGTGGESVTGVLEIRPLTQTTTSTSSAAVSGLASLVTFASSRTYNQTANGTFGQFIPAIPFANFVGKATATSNSVLSLQQIAQSARYRTNLGFVEGSGQPASLLVTVFGSNGAKVTSFPVQLTGGQHLQLNSFLAQNGVTSLNDGRVEVQVTSSTGKVTAYASVLDNETADPLLVTPVTLSEAGQTKWVVPGVADLANGIANWQTDMRIFNAGTAAVDATLSFHSQNGGQPIVKTLTIPAGEVRQLDKTVANLFGATNDGGAVHITTPAASRLIATARTYNQTSTGTYGQFISAVTPAEAVGVGSRPLQLLQLEESDRYRSNVGFAEVTGNPVKLEVGIVPPEGKTTAYIQVDLAANEFRQLNSLLNSIGLRDTHNARITVRAISGTGRAAAYASVVDMETQDPTYIPAQ